MAGAAANRPGEVMGPRRDVHFFWLLDASTSMQGEKIQSLNFAVASAIPEMRRVAAMHPEANVLVRVLKFATGVEWVVADPVPIAEFKWRDIEADGETSMGLAFSVVCDELDKLDADRRYLPPALLLVTDGHPTDEEKDFEKALHRLLTHKLGAAATRLAIAIGSDVGPEGMECLNEFINNPEIKPIEVTDLAALPRLMQIVSRSALEISSTPGDAAAAKVLAEAAKSDADIWTWQAAKPLQD
jgi:uncharacterized protein YegL